LVPFTPRPLRSVNFCAQYHKSNNNYGKYNNIWRKEKGEKEAAAAGWPLKVWPAIQQQGGKQHKPYRGRARKLIIMLSVKKPTTMAGHKKQEQLKKAGKAEEAVGAKEKGAQTTKRPTRAEGKITKRVLK